MTQSLSSQKGLSILEVLFSLAVMSVALTGFLEASKASMMANKRQLHRQDFSMIRYFIVNNFSCDDSLLEDDGKYSCPSDPKTFEAKNHTGEVFASGTGRSFGLTEAGKEPFQLTAQCIQDGNQVRVAFKAKFNGINPLTGKAYTDSESLKLYKDAAYDDVNQGNDVVCTPAAPVEPPTNDFCSIRLVDSATGKAKTKIPGVYFRDPNAMGLPKWTKAYPNIPKYFAWQVLVTGQDAAVYGDDNKPDGFQIQFILKDPKASIASYKKFKNTKIVTDDPDSDQYAAGGKPIPGEVFKLNVCTGSTCATDKKAINVFSDESSVPPSCKKSSSSSSSSAKATFCNNTYFWRADIPVNATQTVPRQDPETDWYNSSVDMKVVAMRGTEAIATCSTTFTLISPLVLVWPEGGIPKLEPTTSRFDLDGDGTKDQIGWVSGQAGFLALDLNKNGQVDSGRELFGDATRQPSGMGPGAVNGFEALRQYDANHDSVIDRQDPVFSDLLVWFDRDGSGTTDPWEAVPLALLGVDKIELTYQEVKNPPDGSSPYVKARLEARFYGSGACEKGDCPIYDLYFVKL